MIIGGGMAYTFLKETKGMPVSILMTDQKFGFSFRFG